MMETIRASKLFFITKPGSGVFYEVWTQSTLIKVKNIVKPNKRLLYWQRLIQLYEHNEHRLKGWLSERGLILLLSGPAFLAVNILSSVVSCQCPSHRTQSIRSCRNHCQELCQECQTIARDFENPFSIGHLDLGLHVFADILYLR